MVRSKWLVRPSNLASAIIITWTLLLAPLLGCSHQTLVALLNVAAFLMREQPPRTVEPGVRIVLLLSSTFMASDACLTSEFVSTTPGSVCRLTGPCNLGKACQLKGKPFYFLCRAFSRRWTSLWSSVTNWAKLFLERVGGKIQNRLYLRWYKFCWIGYCIMVVIKRACWWETHTEILAEETL